MSEYNRFLVFDGHEKQLLHAGLTDLLHIKKAAYFSACKRESANVYSEDDFKIPMIIKLLSEIENACYPDISTKQENP